MKTKNEVVLKPNSAPIKYEVCPDCGARFASQSLLDAHRVKKGHRSYTCENCNKKFGSQAAVDQHKRATGHDSFECDQCRARFSDSFALETHSNANNHVQKTFQ